MEIPLEENPTRQRILTLLKKNGAMSVADLGRGTDITNMAVRQHLLYLERKGDVRHTVKRFGRGRPVFQYNLTPKADVMFPRAYDELASDVLAAIELADGRKKLDKVFKERNDLLAQRYEKALARGKGVPEKAAILAGILEAGGAMAELDRADGGLRLREFNCPIQAVAEKYPEVCGYELDLYRALLGGDVQRTQCMREGAPSCDYLIGQM